MALNLDDNQRKIIDVKSKPEGTRPKFFNAGVGEMQEISTDFEAFLILQGRSRNTATVQWLDQCSEMTVRDLARDALAAQALKNDIDDAENSQFELSAYIDFFSNFKTGYDLSGFENVTEAGMLLQDLQRPMQEVQTLVNRLKHRQSYCTITMNTLSNSGVNALDKRQVDSWYSPLSAY